jgi:tRNA threonylcarbamoyladenosine biosynthesis protein TsaB
VITLAVEASTYVGSVCVARGRDVLAAGELAMRDPRSERLLPAIAATLRDAGVQIADADRIVCGAGPGSFTSLRIAAAIAKGLAMTVERPLFAVSSLALMVAAIQPALAAGEYLAVLDALRGEAYAATCVVDDGGEVAAVSSVRLLPAEEIDALERAGGVVVGEGRRVRGAPHARGLVRTAALFERGAPVDLARWEPDYGRVAEAQRRWEAAHGRALPRG